MSQKNESSSLELLQLCGGYFFFYVLTGLAVKYFMGAQSLGFPGMGGIEYLFYSTLGATLLCVLVVLWKGWNHLDSERYVDFLGFKVPCEWAYIVPSGICTAVVIPTTTLMYSLPLSVMVAMIIMRGAVIVISRFVDMVQMKQGLFKKKIYPEENGAVVLALLAVSVPLLNVKGEEFAFLQDPFAVGILISYIFAYAFRLYIMNYFKNRPSTKARDNRQFFGVEQIASSITLWLAVLVIIVGPWSAPQIEELRSAAQFGHPSWMNASFSGLAYGMVAFFSVFIFMFKGRSATFAGLVNRLTSLIAGTAATLLIAFFWGGKWPSVSDWTSFGLIMGSVYLLTMAEKRRMVAVPNTSKEKPLPAKA